MVAREGHNLKVVGSSPTPATNKEIYMENTKCWRIYNSGKIIKENRNTFEEVQQWLVFNKNYRPGCALIIDGKVMERGGVAFAQINDIAKQMENETIAEKVPEEILATTYKWKEEVIKNRNLVKQVNDFYYQQMLVAQAHLSSLEYCINILRSK